MRLARLFLVLTCCAVATATATAQTAPRRSFESLRAKDAALRTADQPAPLPRVRKQISAWEAFVRRYPVSGYADDALWAAAELATSVAERTATDADRKLAAKYFLWLAREYPASDKVRAAQERARTLTSADLAAVATASPTKAARQEPVDERRSANPRGVLPPASPTPAVPRAEVPALAKAPTSKTDAPASAESAAPRPDARVVADAAAVKADEPTAAKPASVPTQKSAARLLGIRRAVLPELVRVTIELDDEVAFTHERIDGPARVFFDLRQATADAPLQDRVFTFTDDIVKHVRVGRRPAQTTRVVLDLDGVKRYSVFTLYSPFRIVVDLERAAGPRAVRPDVTSPTLVEQWADATPAAASERATPAPAMPKLTAAQMADAAPPTIDSLPAAPGPSVAPRIEPPQPMAVANEPTGSPVAEAPAAIDKTRTNVASNRAAKGPVSDKPADKPATVVAPLAPATNASGGFSLARQLGLGVSRVVIDPGHGGHDPGAMGRKLNESELVLDVGLRLEKLLRKAGIDVVMTRRTDVFIPLEERTAIANREGADLFLSIHANASRNVKANGVETYFLNFASNPEAEAVAARENSASGQSMHTLPDIVRAIALNNKLDESRDFAQLVQDSMISRLRGQNKAVRNLGVKQAPFVVLIGAGMPSVLAEIAFVTHPQEGQLLRTNAYRQHIADALFEAVQRYMKSLKTVGTVALQD